VDNKRLQQVQNCKYIGCEISYESEKILLDTNNEICSNTENFEQHF